MMKAGYGEEFVIPRVAVQLTFPLPLPDRFRLMVDEAGLAEVDDSRSDLDGLQTASKHCKNRRNDF